MPEVAPNTGVVTMSAAPADAGSTPVDQGTETQGTETQGTETQGEETQGTETQGEETQGQEFEKNADGTDKLDDQGQPVPKAEDKGLLPADVKKVLDEMAKTDAKMSKELKKAYFSNQQYTKEFATPQLAAEAKQLLGSLGEDPKAAVEELLAKAQDLADIDEKLGSGDPEFLDGLWENNPEGMANLVGPSLNHLYKSNPDLYAEVAAPIILNTLMQQNGIVSFMQATYKALTGNKPDDAKAFLEQMAGKIEGLQNFVANKQNDPLKGAKDKLANERKEVQSERQKAFTESVDVQVIPYRNTVISKTLEPFTRGKNIPADQLKRINRSILQEIQETFDSDAALVSRWQATWKTGDRKKIVEFSRQVLDNKIPGIVDAVAKSYNLSTSAARQTNTRQTQRIVIKGDLKGANRTNTAPEGSKDNPIKSEPPMKTIDTRRTSTFMRITQKMAWGKDGKFYRWDGK
jgi:hypothetical protein